MKLVYVAGLLDFINKPICDEFYKILGDDFRFIASLTKTELRKDYMSDYNSEVAYLVKGYEPQNDDYVKELIDDSDVVIFSSGLEKDVLKKRLKSKKITFRVTERLYKEPFSAGNFFRRIISILIHHKMYQQKSNYILCNGFYVAKDFNLFHCYKGRMIKWGYFTETSTLSFQELAKKKNKDPVEILWVGRFVQLKHPEVVVELAKRLRKEGTMFHITMVGGGEMFDSIQQKVHEEALQNLISLDGYKNHDEISSYMERADIYLFTSDRNEGWGAVLLEAMGAACAPVASIEAGSTKSVITDNINGLTYSIQNKEALYKRVKFLIDNSEKRADISQKAYTTIKEEWNPQSAANRFVEMIDVMLRDESFDKYKEGPCTRE